MILSELPTSLAVEVVAGVLLFIIGLSQIYGRRFWAAYYQVVFAYRELGMGLHGTVSAAGGGLVLAFHPIWRGPGALLTFIALLMVAEGGLCLVVPKFGLLRLAVLDEAVRNRAMFFTGATLVVVAGVLALHLWSLVARF